MSEPEFEPSKSDSAGDSPPEAAAGSFQAAPAARRSFWRAWGWRIVLSLLIVVVVASYYVHRRGQVAGFVVLPDTGKGGPFKLVVYLPRLGGLESFRKDQQPARDICRRLALPELPDLSGLDPDGQKQFYNAFLMLRDEPGNHDKYGLLGQLCEAQRFPEIALAFYRHAIDMAPGDYEWHYALGLRLVKDGQSEAADAEFQLASELNPEYAPVWIQLARRAVERGDAQQAIEFINRYIALRPKDPFGYVQRAQVHFDLSHWEEMDKDLTQARTLGPIGRHGHRLLGTLHQHRNETEDARVHLLISAEDKPEEEMDDPIAIMVRRLETFRDPLLNRLEGLVDSRRYNEAIQLVDEISARHKDHRDWGIICGKIAEAYRQLGMLGKASQYAEQARQAMPGQAAPHAELALIHLEAGQLFSAISEADRALAIDPELHVALYARGITRMRMALQQNELRAELRTTDPASHVRSAINDLEKAVAKKPVNHAYLVALATAHGMVGQYDRAGELLATALRVLPNDPQTLALKQKAEANGDFWARSAAN